MINRSMFLLGVVRIEAKGPLFSRFLAACQYRGILLWDISQIEDIVLFWVSIKDLYRLKPLIRKYSISIRILEKKGLSFLGEKIRKRWTYWGSGILCFVFLFFSSQYIWSIDISGNSYYTDFTLLSTLNQWDCCVGMKISEVEEEKIESMIRNNFPQITWVSVSQFGSGIFIEVKEELIKEREKTIEREWDLIAEEDGIVSEIITRTGVPLVKQGDYIEQGQVLISGKLEKKNDAGEVIGVEYVKADGEVCLFQTINYSEKTPLRYEVKEKKKENMQYEMIFLGKRIPFPIENEAGTTAIYRQEKKLYFYSIPLPFRIIEIKKVSYVEKEEKRTKEEGMELEKQKLETYLCKMEKMGVQIIEKNVKIGVSENYSFATGSISLKKKVGIR